jgi:TolA-binding protein
MSQNVKTRSVYRIMFIKFSHERKRDAVTMTCQEMEERLDKLSRKCVELGREYLETRDDKKIVEELYELVWELQTLKNELLN